MAAYWQAGLLATLCHQISKTDKFLRDSVDLRSLFMNSDPDNILSPDLGGSPIIGQLLELRVSNYRGFTLTAHLQIS